MSGYEYSLCMEAVPDALAVGNAPAGQNQRSNELSEHQHQMLMLLQQEEEEHTISSEMVMYSPCSMHLQLYSHLKRYTFIYVSLLSR